MAKRTNNTSTGRRTYGEKPYDVNNSFVKKMTTKVTDLIPQRSWISKWFNTPGGTGDVSNETDNADEQDVEEEALQPPSKRPRIRMDKIHPPGTFMIQKKSRGSNTNHETPREEFTLRNETLDFLQPSMGPSRAFASSTPAPRMEGHNQRQQQNNGAANGADDNSESSESTSGCSSLIPQTNRPEGLSSYMNSPFASRKRGLLDDKTSFTNQRSIRALSLDRRDSLSSRRPSFNASIVTNTNESNASERNSSLLSSPFYNGNTTFGGNNAIGNFRKRAGSSQDFQLKVPMRSSIRVKPSNVPTTTDSTGMSQTARRILEALEHFSSPLSDAKKIPVQSLTNSLSSGQKRPREENYPSTTRVGLRHLTRELAIPTVPDILKLKRRQRLQDTTLAARRIVSAQIEPPKSLPVTNSATTEMPKEYILRSDNDSNKFLGKLRTKLKKRDAGEEERVETVNLPNIPLPITSMPNFDIPLTQTSHSSSLGASSQAKTFTTEPQFKFSSPIKFNEATNNSTSTSNFVFSEPINVNRHKDNSTFTTTNFDTKSPASSSMNFANSQPSTNFASTQPSMNFMWSGSSTAPRPKEKKIVEKPTEVIVEEEHTGGFKPSAELKSGSVMDILGKKTDKVEAGIWECSECLIKNSPTKLQCTACKVRKPDPMKKVAAAVKMITSTVDNHGQFGAQFKMTNDKWECSSCLVRNSSNEIKCVACTTPKEQKVEKAPAPFTTGLSTSKPSLMDQFKPAKNTWECPGCMLRNDSHIITCPCCDASKPGLVQSAPKNNDSEFKKSVDDGKSLGKLQTTQTSNSWECPSCMVRNDAATGACVCCTTPRPGEKALESSASTANSFGDKSTAVSSAGGFGDKFKKPEGSWTCDTCMVSNKADVTKCVACETLKPGAVDSSQKSDASTGSTLKFSFGIPATDSQFKFGIPKAADKKNDTPTNGFTFGAPITQSNPTFSFGVPSTDKSPAPNFTFTSPKSSHESDVKNSNINPPPITGGFSFGTTKTEENKKASDTRADSSKNAIFSFGVPKTEISADSSSSTLFSSSVQSFLDGQRASARDKDTDTNKTSLGFPFSAPSSVTTESSAILSTTNTTTSSTAAPFTFSAPKSSAPKAPLISFGSTSSQSSVTSQSTSASTGFTFTDPKFTESGDKKPISFGNSSVTAPVFGINTQSTDSEKNTEPKTAGFGMEKKPSFGEPETKKNAPVPPAFGSEKSMFNNTTTPSFGSTSAAATGSTSSSLFGPAATPNIFGSASNSAFGAPTPAPTSVFSPPAEQPPATPALFTFGASSQQTPQTSNESFKFNTGNSAASVEKPAFSFGSNAASSTTPATTQPATGGIFGTPNFGTPASSNPVSSAPFSFNAPKADPPSFGQATATAMPSMFGNTSTTASLGQNAAPSSFSATPGTFSFGATAPATGASASPAPSGFNFSGGIQTPAANSTGGFNFNAPAASPQIAFDPNSRPSFNFTGGTAPTMFNATPAAVGQVGGRKIKKAVRRIIGGRT